jgi:hypothetical protein
LSASCRFAVGARARGTLVGGSGSRSAGRAGEFMSLLASTHDGLEMGDLRGRWPPHPTRSRRRASSSAEPQAARPAARGCRHPMWRSSDSRRLGCRQRRPQPGSSSAASSVSQRTACQRRRRPQELMEAGPLPNSAAGHGGLGGPRHRAPAARARRAWLGGDAAHHPRAPAAGSPASLSTPMTLFSLLTYLFFPYRRSAWNFDMLTSSPWPVFASQQIRTVLDFKYSLLMRSGRSRDTWNLPSLRCPSKACGRRRSLAGP